VLDNVRPTFIQPIICLSVDIDLMLFSLLFSLFLRHFFSLWKSIDYTLN
jgi:hypothetical protein